MSSWRASFFTYTGSANSSGFIPITTWQNLIHYEILQQCDELDGVKDGTLVDPALCTAVFRPETLLCTTSDTNTSSCLTPEQVDTVRKVFSPLYGVDGQMIYPALAPGAELLATQRLLSGIPFSYSVDWFRFAVYSNPDWDPSTFTILDAQVAEAKNSGNARTWPSTLAQFNGRGGKLLVYHGGADQQITGFDTERWYNYLSRSMVLRSEELDVFLRFFRVPGMGHCSGGDGAWQVGQAASAAVGVPYDGTHNVLAAIVEWVESGSAPDAILGTKFVRDDPRKGIAFERWHCRSVCQQTV
jgi:feruloyl esterase